MKNTFFFSVSLTILIVSVLGCSFYNPLQGSSDSTQTGNRQDMKTKDKTLADKTIDTTVGEEKIGVRECDELIDKIAEQSKSGDDDYVSKATRQFFLNRIRESVRKSVEENTSDKKQLAKNCLDYQNQLEKFKKEEEDKKGER